MTPSAFLAPWHAACCRMSGKFTLVPMVDVGLGNILSCKVSTDDNGKSKGYGFVHYEKEEAAKEAILKVNGMKIADSTVFVGPFIKREETQGLKMFKFKI